MDSREELLFKVIDYLRRLKDFEESLQENLIRTKVGYDWHKRTLVDPALVELVLKLIERLYLDSERWIHYWIYDLDFGIKWTPGTVIDSEGKDIKLATEEDLAIFLERKLIFKSKMNLQELDQRLNNEMNKKEEKND